jgi:hypothetical protein
MSQSIQTFMINCESQEATMKNPVENKTMNRFSILSNNEMKACFLELQEKWYRRFYLCGSYLSGTVPLAWPNTAPVTAVKK